MHSLSHVLRLISLLTFTLAEPRPQSHLPSIAFNFPCQPRLAGSRRFIESYRPPGKASVFPLVSVPPLWNPYSTEPGPRVPAGLAPELHTARACPSAQTTLPEIVLYPSPLSSLIFLFCVHLFSFLHLRGIFHFCMRRVPTNPACLPRC